VLAKLNASCGTLTVAENRNSTSQATIQLPVAIIPSVTQPPEPDPIVFMAGGPGQDALNQAPALVSLGLLNQTRNVIVMNQRGVADTQPALTCPEIDKASIHAVGLPYDSPNTGALHVAATKACHDRFVAQGIDLSAFNTSQNSADFADLRVALDIPQWNVYALSYGTDLALSEMRDYPSGIRSVIIDSVVVPSRASLGYLWVNTHEGITDIFDACAAQPTCVSAYGDLSSEVATQVQTLEANPLTTTVQEPFGEVKVVLDGGALINWLGSPPDGVVPIASIPEALGELFQGQPTQIAESRAAGADPSKVGTTGWGLWFGVICSEWVPYEPESQILAQGQLAFPTYPESVLSLAPGLPFMTQDCGVWDVPAAPALVRQPTVSTIPTLVMAGSFDGITSPQAAQLAAQTLSNSTTVIIPGAGHGALFSFGLPDGSPANPCAQKVVASFLDDPTSPDTSCVSTLSPPTFTTSPGGMMPSKRAP
jgi:pimeloyl-ACP methyl ester carboxylesterase